MSALLPSPAGVAGDIALFGPQPGHSLGPVEDDWAAIAVWLAAVDDNSSSGTGETIKTYGYHLAKLRWYCERVLGRTPSYWNAQDAKAFKMFLAELPASAVSAVGAKPGDDGYTPFRKAPGASSQADILRFLHALFKALHGTGYMRRNPMELMKTGKARRLDKTRSISLDLFDLVLQVMDASEREGQNAYRLHVRDRFIFICLRETGLRASELIGARMGAIRPLSDPKNRETYWVIKVEGETAKGGRERTIPLSVAVLDALVEYRSAFGLDPLPGAKEEHGLVLSIRTKVLAVGGITMKRAADRRFFGAWRDVGTRFGLHGIIKGRIKTAAEHLEHAGRKTEATELIRVSAHWMRHTFATAALLGGQDLRIVASALGHASVTTTMAYTEQDALDLIRSWEFDKPGSVAKFT